MNKTILQICPRLDSGGIERGTVDVAKALQQLGYKSIVVSAGGYLEQELAEAGVEHIRMPVDKKKPLAVFRNASNLAKLIKLRNIDLVHARSRIPIWCAVLARNRAAFSLVTGCHSLHDSGWFNLKKFYNRGIACGDRIVATSECVSHYLRQEYAVPQEKITCIYRGVDEDYFVPRNGVLQLRQELLQTHAVPTDKRVLLMPGRISRWKGQHVFLKAFASLAQREQLVALLVGSVGSAHYMQEIEALIQSLSLQDHVFVLGESQQMSKLYAVADLVVSASVEPESFGRIAVESQAAGCMTIATDLGGARETIIPGKTGFLVQPGCSASLARAMTHALSLSPEQVQALQTNARQHMQQHFSKQSMFQKLHLLYREILT